MDIDSLIPTQQNRKHVYNKLMQVLTTHAKNKSPQDIQKMALNLERGILNTVYESICGTTKGSMVWDNTFKIKYMSRAVTIVTNLNPDSYLKNTYLLPRLLNNECNEFEVCSYGPDKLFPDKWNERIREWQEEFDKEFKKEERPDGILRCGKCRSFKTEYNERQTRSADEPTTKFCYCHNCGHRWRFC